MQECCTQFKMLYKFSQIMRYDRQQSSEILVKAGLCRPARQKSSVPF